MGLGIKYFCNSFRLISYIMDMIVDSLWFYAILGCIGFLFILLFT